MSTQAKGAKRERQVAELYRSKGWIVAGTGDAHGASDLLCTRSGEIMLIQVKANKSGGAFKNFGPDDRAVLLAEAYQAGGRALLVWWPADRQGPRYIYSDDWPENGSQGV